MAWLNRVRQFVADTLDVTAAGLKHRETIGEIANSVRRQDYFAAIIAALSLYRKEHGTMLMLMVDSARRTIKVEVQMKDQAQPLTVSADQYDVVRESGQPSLRLQGLRTSNSSINVLLKTFGIGDKPLPLPPQYAELIEQLL